MIEDHNSLKNQASFGGRKGLNGEPLVAAKNLALVRRHPQLECNTMSWVLYLVPITFLFSYPFNKLSRTKKDTPTATSDPVLVKTWPMEAILA